MRRIYYSVKCSVNGDPVVNLGGGCETEGSDLLLIDEGKIQNVSAMFQYDIIWTFVTC